MRTFAQEEAEVLRYSRALEEASAARAAANTVHALHLAPFAAVPSTAVAGRLWYGGQLVGQGRLTVGELTTVVPLALEVGLSLTPGCQIDYFHGPHWLSSVEPCFDCKITL